MGCNFKCLGDKCKTNCCGAFQGVVTNIVSLDGKHNSEIPLDSNSLEHIINNGLKDKIYFDDRKKLFYIDLNEDKSCPFFSNGLCGIHSHKPPICRAYPFYIDPMAGMSVDTNCPGVEITNEETDYEKEYPLEVDGIKRAIKLHL